ncbi:uncharacterized protein LOC108626291 [Ceratina calcarata]|uniref:Uncharacterized protein LOC108626291 n=1 Tax=Ceratina calcarata TaxID=156304 RepID=A0AAJ7N8M8_9HYME|nr:uncharacterized protein LOC108626291 [Ceratina calcarata]
MGNQLADWINKFNIQFRAKIIIPDKPTFKSGSLLDIAIIDWRLNNINNKLIVQDYDSDHNATNLYLKLKETISKNQTDDTEKACFLYKKTNWPKYKEQLNNTYKTIIPDDRNLAIEEIDSYLDEIEDAIKETIEKVTPRLNIKNRLKELTNFKIVNLHKKKQKLQSAIHRRVYRRDPTNIAEITALKKEMKIIKNEIHKEFCKNSNEHWRKLVQEIDYRESAKFFPNLNKIFRRKAHRNIDSIIINKTEHMMLINKYDLNKDVGNGNGGDATSDIITVTDQELLPEIIGSQLKVINTLPSLDKNNLRNIVYKKVKDFREEKDREPLPNTFTKRNSALWPTNDSSLSYLTNFKEVKCRITKISNKTSHGFDGIPNIIIKNSTNRVIRNYTILFNNLLNWGYFPNKWKTAKVIVLVKKRDKPIEPDNLRPISLLPVISKIYERIINRTLTTTILKKEIIPEQQFGFKKGHSTIHAINKLMSDVLWHHGKNELVGACLIDLRKAFDSVWLEGLIYKLIKKNFPHHLIKIIDNMITNRKFKVAIEKRISKETFAITRGLQQGTVNSPTLFNIYNADILNMFNMNENSNLYAIAFADDLIVYAANKNLKKTQMELQETYNKIKHYYNNWLLQINPSKCETILFINKLGLKSKITKRNWRNFRLIDIEKDIVTEIPHRRHVKYLGVTLDDRLNFSEHIISQLFYNIHLERRTKVIAYQCLIRPILTYACPIWYNISACKMEAYRLFERKCLRACLRYYREPEYDYRYRVKNTKIYTIAKIARIDIFIIKLIRKHIRDAINNKYNSLIWGPYYPKNMFYKNVLRAGLIPPEAFLYLDLNNYIINEYAQPILYHVPRNNNNKSITYKPRNLNHMYLVYNTNVTAIDIDTIRDFKYFKK